MPYLKRARRPAIADLRTVQPEVKRLTFVEPVEETPAEVVEVVVEKPKPRRKAD